MKKLIIILIAFTAVFTACSDRDQTPAPTGIAKFPTLPTDTIDVRDMAAGLYFSIFDTDTNYFSFENDTAVINEMVVTNLQNGYVDRIVDIDGQDWGFVCVIESTLHDESYFQPVTGIYEIEEERFTFRNYKDAENFEDILFNKVK